jgi:hypothetical protein
VNGDLSVDNYLVIHLSQCAMTLISTFENGSRLTKIIKSITKALEKSKDKVLQKEQRAMQGPIRICLTGLNAILK